MTLRLRHAADEGFTLIEVIVSLLLLSIVSTAALYFFFHGTRAITHEQRTQNAVQVANQAMEDAHAVVSKPSAAGVSGLLAGRAESVVDAAWTASAGLSGLSDMYPAWDGTADSSSVPAVPIVSDTTLDGVQYEATTLIGACYRNRLVSTGSFDCDKLAGYTDDPGAPPAGSNTARLLKVLVHVTWQDGTCSSGAGCSYLASSLVDANGDLVWNTTSTPVAYDDVGQSEGPTVIAGSGAVYVDVLANDLLGVVTTNPITLKTTPTVGGSASVMTTGEHKGTVQYTPPTNASGIAEFAYVLNDGSHPTSNQAVARVPVLPKSANDTASLPQNQASVAVAVLTNDKGTFAATPVLETQGLPTGATVSQSGSTLVFAKPAGTPAVGTTYTFQYRVKSTNTVDTRDLWSEFATVTVTITNPVYPTPAAAKVIAFVNATTSATIPWSTLTSNTSDYSIQVTSITGSQGQASLAVGGAPVTVGSTVAGGSTLVVSVPSGYTQPTDWTVNYNVVNPGDGTTAAGQIHVLTVPTLVNDAPSTMTFLANKSTSIDVDANDTPANFASTTWVIGLGSTPAFPASCGTLTAPGTGTGEFTYKMLSAWPTSGWPYSTPVASPITCSFQYTVTVSSTVTTGYTQINGSLVSNLSATVSFQLKKS